MRTANPIERAIQQEIKRRTSKVRVFPNRDALLRLATAVLVEIDEDWATSDRIYINCSTKMTDAPKSEFPDIRLLNRTFPTASKAIACSHCQHVHAIGRRLHAMHPAWPIALPIVAAGYRRNGFA